MRHPSVYFQAFKPNNAMRKGLKINQRLLAAPHGAVLTAAWLRRSGISNKLSDYYVRAGWLHRLGDGAFTVLPETPDWLGAIAGLQQKTKCIHPGGLTALELAGLAHFLSPGDAQPLYFFGRQSDRLPKWLKNLPWFPRVKYVRTNFLPPNLALREHRQGDLVVAVSTPERAALEFLHILTPDAASYEHASLVFEGLGTLRPSVVQKLLEACASIKVKRLFLHLAEKHGHGWFDQLRLSKIQLGSGKRLFVADGALDPKYLITIPASAPQIPSDAP